MTDLDQALSTILSIVLGDRPCTYVEHHFDTDVDDTLVVFLMDGKRHTMPAQYIGKIARAAMAGVREENDNGLLAEVRASVRCIEPVH